MVDPIAKINMDNKFFDKTESRQADAGDPGNQGLRGPRDPGVPCLHGGGHAPDADFTLPACSAAAEAGWGAR